MYMSTYIRYIYIYIHYLLPISDTIRNHFPSKLCTRTKLATTRQMQR